METHEIVLRSSGGGRPSLKLFFSEAQAGHRSYMTHHHAQIEISAIVSGSCEWQIRHMPRACRTGDVIILGSDEEHYITCIDGDRPLRLMNLQFEPRFIWSPGNDLFDERYLSIFLNHDESFDNRLPEGGETAAAVFRLMEEMLGECRLRQAEYELIVKAKLMLVLGLLGREYSGMLRDTEKSGEASYLAQMDAAVNYINAGLSEELTLESVARSAGMSRSYFSTVFRQLNGITVWSYITNKRIELAMRLLRDTGMRVVDVAGASGFGNLANFNRSFRRSTHMSPTEYRKSFLI